jgi:hypothetical protein
MLLGNGTRSVPMTYGYSTEYGSYTLTATDITDDYASTISTLGTIAISGTTTGEIERSGDNDWFKVSLIANHQYQFELKGSPTSDGTLSDPQLKLLDTSGATTLLVQSRITIKMWSGNHFSIHNQWSQCR